MHVRERLAHGSQLVAVFGAVQGNAARGLRHAVTIVGRLADVMEELGNFRLQERAGGDDEFQIAAENGADFGKDELVELLELFCLLSQPPVLGRFFQGRVEKLFFHGVGIHALHDSIVNLGDDARNAVDGGGFRLLDILHEFFQRFDKGNPASEGHIIMQIAVLSVDMRPGQYRDHLRRFVEIERVDAGPGGPGRIAVGDHGAFGIARGA